MIVCPVFLDFLSKRAIILYPSLLPMRKELKFSEDLVYQSGCSKQA